MQSAWTLAKASFVFAFTWLALSTLTGAEFPPSGEWTALLSPVLDRGTGIAVPRGSRVEEGWTADAASGAGAVVLPFYFPEGPEPVHRTERVGKGDTLLSVLLRTDVPRAVAHEAMARLRTVYNPRRLNPGQEVDLTFRDAGENEGGTFLGLRLQATPETVVGVEREPSGGFATFEQSRNLERDLVRSANVIESSLFESATAAGVPAPVVVDLIRTYSYDVDFQRDIHPGDAFEAMFERFTDENGELSHYGQVTYAVLRLGGTPRRIYRHTTLGGETDYFNENGESVRKALMKTPVDGARLSSRFGRRRHPVLGYTRLHKGLDFAAPHGTPVVAAGDGVVELAGRNGGYGKYVRLRHNAEFSTAYAHLSRFAGDIRKGRRVRQGQVIAYVGSTGVSTGPHLHYEVVRNGRHVNPLTLELPSGRRLDGKELERFRAARAEIEAQYAALASETHVASR